jgi:glyoxylase-like metal-dependent hydrolase (beta-lactamase superfamily II)
MRHAISESSPTLTVGDARLDRVVDIPRFELAVGWLFPDADQAALAEHRSWLDPHFMSGEMLALSIHSVVLRVAGRVILVDTCVGEHKPRPRQPAWNERRDTDYLARLAAIGIGPEQVDIVFCTHLHADHVGWNTRLRDGRWVPTFPNARYLIGRAELAYWQARLVTEPAEMVNHGSYADSVLPIVEAQRVDLVDSDHEVLDGLIVQPLPGHSPGQVGLLLRRQGQGCLLVGDAIHHPVQLVQPDWSSRLCSDPSQARETRHRFLNQVADRGDWLVPMHFMNVTGMRIRRLGDVFGPADTDSPRVG